MKLSTRVNEYIEEARIYDECEFKLPFLNIGNIGAERRAIYNACRHLGLKASVKTLQDGFLVNFKHRISECKYSGKEFKAWALGLMYNIQYPIPSRFNELPYNTKYMVLYRLGGYELKDNIVTRRNRDERC